MSEMFLFVRTILAVAPAFWKLAKVEELLPGRDGTVRAAIVTIPRGTSSNPSHHLRQPIHHLIPTEVKPVALRDFRQQLRSRLPFLQLREISDEAFGHFFASVNIDHLAHVI